jgi:GNAT superfamily N-acetyltransferase
MVMIRTYQEQDAARVGLLIKDTYNAFNLDFLPDEDRRPFLGPFYFAGSTDPDHLQAIKNMIRSQFVYVAQEQGEVVGILRGRMDRLGSLFVAKSHQGREIGSRLVDRLEEEVRSREGKLIRVASSLYAVPIYLSLGYKRSTGIRQSWSFEGYGLPIQPMKKSLI